MSPRDPGFEDPFNDDERARERARRRAERESKRRERDNRASLAERVSGALEGATSKGREAIEQTRERARSPEPPADGVDPPSFRRPAATRRSEPDSGESVPPPPEATPAASPEPAPETPAPREPVARATPPESKSPVVDDTVFERPGDAERRLSPDEVMPRRESVFTPRPIDTGEEDAVAPAPVTGTRPSGESEEWAAPPPIETGGGSGGSRGRPPRRRPAASTGWELWRRRLLALGAIVVLVAGGAFALSKLGGADEPAPTGGGEKAVKTVDIVIPEGLTAEEIGKVAKKAGLKGDYVKAEKEAAKKFDVQKLGGPKDATLEGFLFPATYNVERGANVSALIDKQLTEGFEANFAQVDMKAADKAGMSEFDVVTIASMIEREVQVADERPIVSSVIYNRLDDGMALGIDATVRYALDNNFTDSLSTSDLEVDSCYNTYTNPGLPCGPISNPGLDSLQAAANPDNTDFLYYVVKPGTCPAEHTFTESYDEFAAASAEYDAAQAEAGGSPTC